MSFLCLAVIAGFVHLAAEGIGGFGGFSFGTAGGGGSGTVRGGELVSGRVVRVMDGDTYELLLEDKTTVRIRMDGIDAPETAMPYYRAATDYLKELTRDQIVSVSLSNKDQYGRVVSYSWLSDGRELGKEMIRAGLAWHYKQYNSDKELAALEIEARDAKRGLWVDKKPLAPWDVRRWRRQGMNTREIYERYGQ